MVELLSVPVILVVFNLVMSWLNEGGWGWGVATGFAFAVLLYKFFPVWMNKSLW